MNVRLKEAICGYEVGAVISVSTERGSGWIERGYAVYAGNKPAPKIPTKEVPEVTAKQRGRKPGK